MTQIINGRYLLHEQLGAGGMGVVYRATDRLTGDIVALKSVTTPPQLLEFGARGQVGDTDASRLALAREFQILASLRHPHIITVLDYGFDVQHVPYFTMDYLAGGQTIREAAQKLPLPGQVDLLVQLLQALTYLHRRDILHRDLKPGNVLVVNGRLKVLDFGLSISRNQDVGGTSGTLSYMAPELLQGQPTSQASDLFAVGVLAYELFAGRLPFNSLLETLTQSPPWMGDTLPPGVEDVIYRLLEKEAVYRPPDAETVIKELCWASNQPPPPETAEIRESALQTATFVGREAELVQLTESLYDALDGNGSAWLIGGESGIGKSRLLNELRTQALVTGALVVRGQHAGNTTPYHIWQHPLRRLILASPPNYLNASILKEVVPDIGALMGQHIPDAPPVDGKTAKQRLILTIAHLFSHSSRPLVLLLEDLPDDPTSLEPLQHLVQFADVLPLLVVASYRNDETPNLPQLLPRMKLMTLERLPKEAIATLSASILGTAGQHPYFLEQLQRETEGNAFFLVETIRVLAEEAGQLERVARATISANLLSGGIQRMMERRLQRIPPESWPMLQLTAVIGRQLDLELLQTAAQTDRAAVENWLMLCANTAVLEFQDGHWQFNHEKLRTAVLNTLPPDETQQLHHQIALAIEHLYAETAEYILPLAHHWKMAGDTTKQRTYTLQAGQNALRTGIYPQALHLLEEALSLTSPDDISAYATLKQAIGSAQNGLSNYPAAIQNYQESLVLYQTLNDQEAVVRLLNFLGNVANATGQYAQARQYHQQCLTLSQSQNNPDGLASAYMGLGIAADYTGDYATAIPYYEQSLELFRHAQNMNGVRQALGNLGIVAYLQGKYAHSIPYLEEALTVAQQTGNLVGMAYSHMTLGLSNLSLNHYSTAATHLHQSLAICRETGDKLGMARAFNNLSELERQQKKYAEARHLLEQSLAICREIGDRRGVALAHNNLGELARAMQEYPAAHYHYTESLAICEAIGEKYIATYSLHGLGCTQLANGEGQEALDSLQKALQQATETNAVSQILLIVVAFARVVRQKRPNQAITWLSFVETHPLSSPEVKQEATDLLAELKTWLPSELLTIAVSRANELELENILFELKEA